MPRNRSPSKKSRRSFIEDVVIPTLPSSADSSPLSLTTTFSSSPTKSTFHQKPTALRLDALGVDPVHLVGRVLSRVTQSPNHPSLTLAFSDGTKYQILVDGYNPSKDPEMRGVPKLLEMDTSLHEIFNPADLSTGINRIVSGCTHLRLSDKAFSQDQKWNQDHVGLAFKFADAEGWHCIWAIMAEHDPLSGVCTFRSYEDVYLKEGRPLPSPTKSGTWSRSSSGW